ncbi:hypothetical protein ACH9EU_09375 [Kocuria sp. M1R5S2]|uniref:hypothetical protein n=1 Tax=Kocuria rhizosphaerae TaxID=3376285 RepID=UPI0037B707F0
MVIAQGMTAQVCSLERADRFILTLEERRTAGRAAVRPVSLGTPVLPSLWCRAMMERFGGRPSGLGVGRGAHRHR